MNKVGRRLVTSSVGGGALLKLITFVVIFGGVIAAAWIFFLPSLLTSALEKRTGFNVKVGRLTINPFQSRVDLDGLIVRNPYTFPRDDFLSVRSFHANVDLLSFFGENPVVNSAQIEVAYVALVRSTDGTTNAVLFEDRLLASKEKPPEESAKASPGKAGTKPLKKEEVSPQEKPMPFLIKHLELKVDKLMVSDFYGRKVVSHDYDLHFEHTYENVTDAQQLLNPVAIRGLSSVGAAIGGLIPGDLGKIMGAATRLPENFRASGKNPPETAKSPLDGLEESRKP